MEYDYDARESKRDEIADIAREAFSLLAGGDDGDADAVAHVFARVTPPTKPETNIAFITLNATGGQGQSRKPGNITLSWKKLIDIVPDTTIAGAGVATAPAWLLPFIALYIWNKLWCGANEELSENEAAVMLALWKHRKPGSKLEASEGFARTNDLRSANGKSPLTATSYQAAIARLVRMKCIEIDNGVIWLREWVRVTY